MGCRPSCQASLGKVAKSRRQSGVQGSPGSWRIQRYSESIQCVKEGMRLKFNKNINIVKCPPQFFPLLFVLPPPHHNHQGRKATSRISPDTFVYFPFESTLGYRPDPCQSFFSCASTFSHHLHSLSLRKSENTFYTLFSSLSSQLILVYPEPETT